MTDITERLRGGMPSIMAQRDAACEIDHLRARVAELEAARQKSAAIDKLARSMIRDWGRRDEAGYRFPDTVPLIISTRDACVPDDLVRQILGWADEET